MSRQTLARELDVIVRKRPDPLRHKSEKTLLNLELLYVIHSSVEFFLSKYLLHILGQLSVRNCVIYFVNFWSGEWSFEVGWSQILCSLVGFTKTNTELFL